MNDPVLHADQRLSRSEGAPASVMDNSRGPGHDEGWRNLPEFRPNKRHLARNRIVAASRANASHVAIDMLRTRLMSMARENHWNTIGITSPRGGCGKTTIAINLAFSLAQQAKFRVGLLDLDLHRPRLAYRLGLNRSTNIEAFLRGRASMSDSLVRYGDNLVIAPNTVQANSAAELLMELSSSSAIQRMRESLSLDLVIFDLPPMLATDDVLAILPAVDTVLLVAAAEETVMSNIDLCEKELSTHGKFGGLILNKTRYLPDRYGY